MFKFFKSLFGSKPLPPSHSEVIQRKKLQLPERYHVSQSEALHAQHIALEILSDLTTIRTKVHSDSPSTEVYNFFSSKFPDITLELYRPYNLRHSWVILFPKLNGNPRRRVLLPIHLSPKLDEAEFYFAEDKGENKFLGL